MQGTVEINGLVVFAHHGVHETERSLGQRFVLDIAFEFDMAAAARGDRLADTVDYAEVVAVAEAAFGDRQFSLIEAAAAHVAGALLTHFARIETVRVTVRKPSAAIPAALDHVAVQLTRRRDD
jgi:dihydroneopterin aldolase